jgi:hypothetical protein
MGMFQNKVCLATGITARSQTGPKNRWIVLNFIYDSKASCIAYFHISVLLPNDNTKLFSMSKMEPAVEIAKIRISKVFFKDSRVSFNVTYLDSKCSGKYAIQEAFESYMKLRTIHLFLGPVCDLAVMPVAKQTLAISTAGSIFDMENSLVLSFGRSTEI